jgi:nucleotide-binding universal stress UspA family protein
MKEASAMFNRILFPVDLSEASNRMVPCVKEVVEKFRAELHIIHIKSVRKTASEVL